MGRKDLHKKNTGFILPKGYFEEFEDRLFHKLNEQQPEPLNKNGLQVPDGYFEHFEGRLFEKLEKETKVIKLNPYKKYYYAVASIAATILLVVSLNVLLNRNSLSMESLTSTEIENYIDHTSIDAYDIAQLYSDVNLEDIQLITEPLADEELIDYLASDIELYEELILEN
ncbi:hypothetical protein [Leptobacterium sp. I13]|uniref:hypothetical protein n=1 Tax=Leptobacterium meishanense TaxID=3128904 RepID=UPI0030EBF373